MRETINQKVPDVADTLFNGFVRIDESINGLRSNCNKMVTQILKYYKVNDLVVFNQDVDIELQSVLENFQSFYDRVAINEIVGNYFIQSFVNIEAQLSEKLDELINSIDNNEKANQCYVNVNNDSITKMLIAFRDDIIQVAGSISKSFNDESINFQNSVAVTVSTMKSDFESCLSNASTSVSCLNNYVSIINNYETY